MPINIEKIKRALDLFEANNFVEAEDILRKQIRKARNEWIREKLDLTEEYDEKDNKQFGDMPTDADDAAVVASPDSVEGVGDEDDVADKDDINYATDGWEEETTQDNEDAEVYVDEVSEDDDWDLDEDLDEDVLDRDFPDTDEKEQKAIGSDPNEPEEKALPDKVK